MKQYHTIAERIGTRAAVAALALAGLFAGVEGGKAIDIETVGVGNPGNANYSASGTPRGAVAYSYSIGKYEVTKTQYTEFLNSVGATNTFGGGGGIYTNNAGITQSGLSGSYTYSVNANMNLKPTTASWYAAARFCNWMHNGANGSAGTEVGAYTLNSTTTSNWTTTVARNSGAIWALPTVDEWVKAAYYDPTKDGTGGYRTYTTQSDVPPTKVTADGTGTGSAGATGNFANYGGEANWNGGLSPTSVGTNGGASYYGTFDQGGNMGEMVTSGSNAFFAMGGDFGATTTSSTNGSHSVAIQFEGYSIEASSYFLDHSYPMDTGFRVVSLVPEPGSAGLLLLGAGAAFLLKRRRH